MTAIHPGEVQTSVLLDGWAIQNVTLPQALDGLERLAQAPEPSMIVTPNLQHLRNLRRGGAREAFRGAYQAASMRFADGMPLVWASKVQGDPLAERVAGSDLEPGMCERLQRLGGQVLYIGGKTPEAANRAITNRRAQFPGLWVDGRSPSMEFATDPAETRELVTFINDTVDPSCPAAIFVCAGSPKSEIWAAANLPFIRHGVVMPVGAAVDFASGEKERASERAQRRGLEWLHRLRTEPRRLGPRYARDALFLGGLMARSLGRRFLSAR